MSESKRRPILANGEKYVGPVDKKKGFSPPEMPRSYEEARALVKREIEASLEKLAALPPQKRFSDEVVLCLRLHPDMIAKSYDPKGIFGYVPELENIGSRNYRLSPKSVAPTKRITRQINERIHEITGRMVFVRSDDAGFRQLLKHLDRSPQSVSRAFQEEIQSIEKFNLIGADEQLSAFGKEWKDWKEGRVEIVLHPSRHSKDEQLNFLRDLVGDRSGLQKAAKAALYQNGPLFVSCRLDRASIEAMGEANPLRTAHPLIFNEFEELRSASGFPSPQPSGASTCSKIKVGMFDGGVDPTHPLLIGHVEQDEALSIRTAPTARSLAHGTAVAGALLYGPLNDRNTASPLPPPAISVVSFRALPTSNPRDMDLYESIDVIEAVVPARPDIKIFNISFGPRGPILDDTISRFTFSLDLLAAKHKVTFCVAVGNDGGAGPGMNRIQAPSDLVNGLGIGAYTERQLERVHAPYSCRGPGRECAKLKPDLVAFGGCDQNPIHLVSSTPGSKALSAGTSFASPIVAALGGLAAESFDGGTALLARALLVHTAEHPQGEPDNLLGHGIVADSLDRVLRCGEKEVTIVFQGRIPAKTMVKLPIMLPPGLIGSGNVEVKWTVSALPPVEPNHPSDYTAMCIEDTFYPHSEIFSYTQKGKSPKRLHTQNQAAEIQLLLADGWKKSKLPASDSGNQYSTESERRAQYKWEPLVRRVKGKRATSFHEPFLVLHAIPRHGVTGSLEYAAIVTITAAKFTGDLYNAVVRVRPALQAIRLRSEAELRIRI